MEPITRYQGRKLLVTRGQLGAFFFMALLLVILGQPFIEEARRAVAALRGDEAAYVNDSSR